MTEPNFNPLTLRPSSRRSSPYRCEKLVSDEWVHVSDFRAPIDEGQLQRHVRAMGGSVRLMRAGKRVREWVCGQEVFP